MINSNKQKQYSNLVRLRKKCSVCQGLVNPSSCNGGQYDSSQIGTWSRWQGNLDAELMIVGQDWGDVNYFLKWKGFDDPRNPANLNLMKLLCSIGVNITPPRMVDQTGEIFLTNAILCLKYGGLQSPVKDEWFQNCGKFMRPLIEIIAPKVVIALGKRAFKTILEAYGIHYTWLPTHRAVVEREGQSGGKKLPSGILLFPVYHCGSKVINMTRDMKAQLNDWKPIKPALFTRRKVA